jgi:hypothetical protein
MEKGEGIIRNSWDKKIQIISIRNCEEILIYRYSCILTILQLDSQCIGGWAWFKTCD